MYELDEKVLIDNAKKGDLNAFEQLIENYEVKVYNISLQMLKNEEDAKDASQEALIKVYKNLNKFDGRSSFSTWIYRVTVNASLDYIRKKKSHKDHQNLSLDENIEVKESVESATEAMPEKTLLQKERTQHIHKAMELLKQEQKTIIVLRDINGLSYKEISEIVGTTEGTVKSRLNRARRKLKELLMDMELFKKECV